MADLVGSFVQAEVNRRAQERAFEQQQELQADAQAYNTLMFNMSNQYNSPIQQMSRFKAAGLNPNLIYGQMANTSSPIGMSSPSSPSPSSIQAPSLLESAQIGLINAQKENIKADTREKEQNIEESGSRIALNQTQEDLNKAMQGLNEAQIKKVNEEIPLIRTEVKKSFQEYRKFKVDADRANEFYDAQIRKLSSEAGLAESEAKDIVDTFVERVKLLKAQANRENWTASELEKQCQLLGEQYVQATYATKIAEAEAGVEGNLGYQWTTKSLGVLCEVIGTAGSIMLGFGALRGSAAAASRAATEGKRIKMFEEGAKNGTTTGFRRKY